MRALNTMELRIVNGGIGPWLEALFVGIAIFELPILIDRAIETYGTWGSKIGEKIYYTTHPDPLGKMIFTKNDFPQE